MFARYAKYDDYYTEDYVRYGLKLFARYAKYDDYYTTTYQLALFW